MLIMGCENLEVKKGKTFRQVIRWEDSPIVYKEITNITQAAPVVVTAVGHDLVDGWRAAIVSVKGMIEINAKNSPPKDSDYFIATPLDANTVEFNGINAADFARYKSGGYLQYNTPKDLTGYSARMTVKTKVGGTQLLSLTTVNGGILLDNTEKKITLFMSATDTADIDWKRGVYELELVSSGGDVVSFGVKDISITEEVTT
jgi:hypothetical protein